MNQTNLSKNMNENYVGVLEGPLNQGNVNNDTILKTYVGSHLYGTNTPQSDMDIVGIFIPKIEYVFGLLNVEIIDKSIKSKDSSGKNDNKAVDEKYYELRKFVKNCIDGSPNMLEILFCNKFLFINDLGNLLIENRKLFISKKIADRFIGYANSQKHKISIKKDNYQQLLFFRDAINNFDHKDFLASHLKDKHVKENCLINYDSSNQINFIKIGDINIHPYSTIGSTLMKVDRRISKFSNRTELINKHGYDTKFAYHLIRLLKELNEILLTGELRFPLSYAEMLLEIKNGEWELQKILKYSDSLLKDSIKNCDNTKISNKPNFNEIQNLVINIMHCGYKKYF